MKTAIKITLLFCLCFNISGQYSSNIKLFTVDKYRENIHLPEKNIVFKTIKIFDNKGEEIKNQTIDYVNKVVTINPENINKFPITIEYRTFSVNIDYKKNIFPQEIIFSQSQENKFTSTLKHLKKESISNLSSINKSGSLSRGVSFGNNQDMTFDSKLNLKIDGRLTENLNIEAVITDNNIPFQPDGYSQNLSDFDNVYIKLYNEKAEITGGNLEITNNESQFLKVNRKGQGAKVAYHTMNNSELKIETEQNIAIAQSIYKRQNIDAKEGNLGPYKLSGINNELHIIILSGSERVYIDGKLLTRGLENDYVIDYNLGEITFTPKNNITMNSRIVIEFEYSDRNYSRYQIFSSNKITSKKSSIAFKYYRQKDNQNKPISLSLDNESYKVLELIGDNEALAIIPQIDSVTFNIDEILYQKIDTIIDGSKIAFYRYSTNESKANFRVKFRYIGQGKGDYIEDKFLGNGKTYKFIAPINDVHQGDYAPNRNISTPKDLQVFSTSFSHQITNNTNYISEVAISYFDKNLYSNSDSKDNTGYAISQEISNSKQLKDSSKISSGIRYQHINKNYNAPEEYRNVEFTRDWGINNPINNSQNFVESSFAINSKKISVNTQYQFLSFSKNDLKHRPSFSFAFNNNKFNAGIYTSLLSSKDSITHGYFLKEKSFASYKLNKLKLGINQKLEQIEWRNTKTDSLQYNSNGIFEVESYLSTKSKNGNNKRLSHTYSQFNIMRNNSIGILSKSNNIEFEMNKKTQKGNSFSFFLNYKNTALTDSISSEIPENTLNSKISYQIKIAKGFITNRSSYMFGSGVENKREYLYIKVQKGKGYYTWTDYNKNGIKELDEFETAHYSDQAEYIRVFKTSNLYEPTYNNNFTTNFFIDFGKLYKGKKRAFSIRNIQNTTIFTSEKKQIKSSITKSLNPFDIDNITEGIVFLNFLVRNRVIYKFNSALRVSHTYQRNKNISSVINGNYFSEKESNLYTLKWRINNKFIIEDKFEKELKASKTDFLDNRNYRIHKTLNHLSLEINPADFLKVELTNKITTKENYIGSEQSEEYTWSIGSTYKNAKSRGFIEFKLDYIQLNYNADSSTPIAYEMLESLKPGNNLVIGVNVSQKLSKYLYLTINYQGRNIPDNKMIHTSSMELKALF